MAANTPCHVILTDAKTISKMAAMASLWLPTLSAVKPFWLSLDSQDATLPSFRVGRLVIMVPKLVSHHIVQSVFAARNHAMFDGSKWKLRNRSPIFNITFACRHFFVCTTASLVYVRKTTSKWNIADASWNEVNRFVCGPWYNRPILSKKRAPEKDSTYS